MLEWGLKGHGDICQWAAEEASDRVPSPCQCILSEPGVLLGEWVLFFIFPFVESDTVVSRARPRGMCPCVGRAKWEEDIKPEATN